MAATAQSEHKEDVVVAVALDGGGKHRDRHFNMSPSTAVAFIRPTLFVEIATRRIRPQWHQWCQSARRMQFSLQCRVVVDNAVVDDGVGATLWWYRRRWQ